MPSLDRLWTLASNGALFLFMLTIAGAVLCLGLGVPISLGAELLGYDPDEALWLLAYLAPLWLPFAAGVALSYMPGVKLQKLDPAEPAPHVG